MMDRDQNYWSTRAQFWRVIKADTRAAGLDIYFSIAYVLASFYLQPHDPHSPIYVVAVPFIITALIMVYFTMRLCEPEGEEKTALFYYNLPRHVGLTWWAHVTWLCGFALLLELLIGAGVLLRLNGLAQQPFVIVAHFPLIPYFIIALWLWMSYRGKDFFAMAINGLAVVTSALALGGLVLREFLRQDYYSDVLSRPSMEMCLPPMVILALTILLFWRTHYLWKKTEVGVL